MANPKYKEWVEDPDKLILLEGWARDGLTDKQIAHNMGIAHRTLCEWKKRYPQFLQSLKKGKEVVDIEVENALIKSAKGFYVVEEEEVWEADESGELQLVRKRKMKKFVPPSNTAQIFWLKNRKPDSWRDKREVVELGGDDNKSGIIEIPQVYDNHTLEGD